MAELRRLCVFCGSSAGTLPEYAAAAQALGELLGRRGVEVVYGGGRVGLMGRLADACLKADGRVIGVIPEALATKELAHAGCHELHVVGSMHERKALMADLADGFVALPGGLGTLDELFEILTWGQLGLHHKPIGLLDVDGYFAPLLTFLDAAVAARFVADEHRRMLLMAESPAALLEAFRAYRPPAPFKWLDR